MITRILPAVCRLPFAVCHLSSIVCLPTAASCTLSRPPARRRPRSAVCRLLPAVCRLLSALCRPPSRLRRYGVTSLPSAFAPLALRRDKSTLCRLLPAVCCLFPPSASAQSASPPPPLAPSPLPIFPVPLKRTATPGDPLRFSAATTVLDIRGASAREAAARARALLGAAGEIAPRETFYLGTPDALRETLEALGIPAADTADLGPEGYALACGEAPETPGGAPRPALVCAAASPRGFRHALAALDQCARPADGGGIAVPRLAVVDRPALPLRGVVEGHDGPPWPHEARLSMIAFAGRHRLNLYLLAPRDDPWLRAKWREPLPPDAAAAIRGLARACDRAGVDLAVALRPGESIRYAAEEDVRLLLARVDALLGLGARAIALLFDGAPDELSHPADRAAFGDAAAARCALAGRVRTHLKSGDPPPRLFFAPSDAWGLDDTPARRTLRERLPAGIDVLWHGANVVARTLEPQEAARAAAALGRAPVMWDNYPATYYAPHRLFLGPLRGRSPAAAERLPGMLFHAMSRPAASRIALATAADFAWNAAGYDADRSWAAAIAEAAGGPGPAADALRLLAENSQSSWIHGVESPRLAARLRAFGEGDAAAPLERELAELAGVRAVLESGLPDKTLAAELAPWTARLETLAARARDAVALARLLPAGDAAAVWDRRLALGRAQEPDPAGGAPPEICGGLLTAFGRRIIEETDRWLGLPPVATVLSSLPAHESFDPAYAADGRPGTAFRSGRAPEQGDHVLLDLGLPRLLGRVEILQADMEHREDYLHDGALEVSEDGTTWREAGVLKAPEVVVDFPAPLTARFVRARARAAQPNWLMVREFAADLLDEPTAQTTLPVRAEQPGLGDLLDRRVETAFATAGPAVPIDAHLTIDLRAPRDLTLVCLLQDPAAYFRRASVRASLDGVEWEEIGEASSPAARLALPDPRRARFLRVAATEGNETPVRIHEIGLGWK